MRAPERAADERVPLCLQSPPADIKKTGCVSDKRSSAADDNDKAIAHHGQHSPLGFCFFFFCGGYSDAQARSPGHDEHHKATEDGIREQ